MGQAGIVFFGLFNAISNQTIIIKLLTDIPYSAQQVVECLQHVTADTILFSAPLMEEVAKDSQALEFISSRLKTITYGTADVSRWVGDAFACKAKVFNTIGATETGIFPLIRPVGPYPSKDWKYYRPHPIAGLDFRPSKNGLHEAFIVKNAQFEDEQPVFKVFPHLLEYSTKDLFVPHPATPGLWEYYGRADDVVSLRNGTLCSPVVMEQHVSNLPGIRTALMAGTGRLQTSLLIEAENNQVDSGSAEEELIERIWPAVDEINQTLPKDVRVLKSHILVMDPQKGAKRSWKGTVQRNQTLDLYQEALDALYIKQGDRALEASYE